MRYILVDEIIDLVSRAHMIILGEPAKIEPTIEVMDPRVAMLVEALGGKSIAQGLDITMTIVTPEEARQSFGIDAATNPSVAAAVEVDTKTGEVSSLKMCEICGTRPVTGVRSKICDDPGCKKERVRRYMHEYNQRKLAVDAGAKEAPANADPLAILGQDPQESAILTNPAMQEMADVPSE